MSRRLLTGARRWTDEAAVQALLATFAPGDVIVHGACPTGLDAIADRLARAMGFSVERHPARWNEHAPGWCRCSRERIAGGEHCSAAGFRRNQEMADAGADSCHGFPLGASRGTRDMMRRAREAGIPVTDEARGAQRSLI